MASSDHLESLGPGVTVQTLARSRRACMTSHWFRHNAAVNCIPVLACQLIQDLIATAPTSPAAEK